MDSRYDELIFYCTNYLRENIDNLPPEYIDKNYSLLFDELITETKNKIGFLNFFELYHKINEAEKINILSFNYNLRIKKLEKLAYISFIFKNLKLPYKFKVEPEDEEKMITNVKYNPKNEVGTIEQMIENFPDFSKYEEEYDNILDIEEKAKVHQAIAAYFEEMRQKILDGPFFSEKMEQKQKDEIIHDLETFILNKLYGKLFPSQDSEADLTFYQKCEKYSLLNPKQIIDKEKLINRRLLKEASEYFAQINMGNSPKEKMDYILKGMIIIQNLISLVTGENKLNHDPNDINDLFIYSIIITKIKNLPLNVQYIKMFLNKNLGDNDEYDYYSTCLTAALIYIDGDIEEEIKKKK